ncbi:MAG: methionyl-tRNA formyltransferase [Alphaproteobacteria bacterium]
MKIVFFGTPDFALPALKALVAKHEVVCVYTKEPKEANRGKKIQKSPIHLFAEQQGIEVKHPKSLKNIFEYPKADLGVVCAYGLILPKHVLEAFPLGCINIHGSVLPRWRGAAPITRAIEAGDKTTGITIMQMDEGLDTGDMLLIEEINIENKYVPQVHDEMAELGGKLIIEALNNLDNITPIKQDDSKANYAHKIDKSEMLLNFNLPAEDVLRKIKAFYGMYFEEDGLRYKVYEASIIDDNKEPLTFMCSDNKAIKIEVIQKQGKSKMNRQDYLRGLK